MFQAGKAPKALSMALLEPALYSLEVDKAQEGDGYYSLRVEVVGADKDEDIGLKTIVFLKDPNARYEDRDQKEKAVEKMKHFIWACGKEGFSNIEELQGSQLACKVTLYEYTNADGVLVKKNGFFPQLAADVAAVTPEKKKKKELVF